MTGVWEELNLLLGRAPSCNWVHSRLAAYEAWDLSLTPREFTVIHEHVHDCPACAVEYAQTVEIVSLLQIAAGRVPLPQIDPEAIADRVLAEISSRQLDREGRFSARKRSLRFKAATAVAVACAVLVAMPVLAYVGQEVWETLSGSGESEVASTDTSDSQVPSVLSDGQTALGNFDAPTGTDTPDATTMSPTTDTTLSPSLDRVLEEAEARAYVESLLPHTEEEYEAWAREEYPHIMWLYDVLMGEMPEKPANSPAGRLVTFGVNEDGDPSITFPDAESNTVTLSMLIPEDGPWNGIPVNTPEWGQRLYADTPESDRPTGWRALLIYSGEIFKLDWPESLDDANCVPCVEPVQTAATIAGLDQGGSATEDYPLVDILGPESPDGYVEVLSANVHRAEAVATYIHISASVIEVPTFDEFSGLASAVLERLCWTPEEQCEGDPLAKELARLLYSREQQIENVSVSELSRKLRDE